MAHLPTGRSLKRLLTLALTTAALAASVAAPQAASADDGAPSVPPHAPQFPLTAVDGPGDVYVFWPDGKGGLGPREFVLGGWQTHLGATHVDHDRDGLAEGAYGQRADGRMFYVTDAGERMLDGQWGQYDQLLSPGDLGGSAQADVIARDPKGVLWLFAAREDATLRPGVRVGPGWNRYVQIAGLGDLTGDRVPDVVGRDRAGVLWLHQGTGDARKAFSAPVPIGLGWNRYNHLTSIGDLDQDGTSDLLARDRAGVLWLHPGTGDPRRPLGQRQRVEGGAGWNQYRLLF
ncbi:FG-GAP repeat domain-containing protein [Streptomyces boluensis]|uniref:VCBS repeat-containing protein n=1 Tax=Streptomyces boluensis TaxID=1775135 RepID=A0A964UVH5_9ACTN|nr:VCBS repeat-containing protein [Streptomyces boluensis]NBE52395.1 hypothetical protein [Streptomyces boluensis]